MNSELKGYKLEMTFAYNSKNDIMVVNELYKWTFIYYVLKLLEARFIYSGYFFPKGKLNKYKQIA